jgi:hypothetical protein
MTATVDLVMMDLGQEIIVQRFVVDVKNEVFKN